MKVMETDIPIGERESSRASLNGKPNTPRQSLFMLMLFCSPFAGGGIALAVYFSMRSKTASYEWSGYGCTRQCDLGDVNYVLEARLESYKVPGSAAAFSDWTEDASMYARTWVGTSGSFCNNNDDGSSGPLGPCLTANPGQTLTVKVKNKLDNGMTLLGQRGGAGP